MRGAIWRPIRVQKARGCALGCFDVARMWCPFLQQLPHNLPQRLGLEADLPVPDPSDENLLAVEKSVPLLVMLPPVGMTMADAVSFDREFGLRTIEVEGVRATRVLTPELVACEPLVTENAPKSLLRPCGLSPQLPGTCGWVHTRSLPSPQPSPHPMGRGRQPPRPRPVLYRAHSSCRHAGRLPTALRVPRFHQASILHLPSSIFHFRVRFHAVLRW